MKRKWAFGAGVVLVVLAALIALALWYRAAHGMRTATGFAVGDATAHERVLIASQGSSFKDAMVREIIAHLKGHPVYVRVVDVSALPDVDPGAWTAVIVMHTWEIGKPDSFARTFFERVGAQRKLIVVTTSGSGQEKVPGFDVISTASVIRELPTPLGEVTRRLDGLLGASR